MNPGDSVCEAFAKTFKMVNLTADQQAFIFTEQGDFTTTFKVLLCATGCAGGGGDTNTSTPDPSSDTASFVASYFVSAGKNRGRFFFVNFADFTYTTINGDMDAVILGMAIRPSDGVVFVLYRDETNDPAPAPLRLGTISTTTGTITPIAPLTVSGVPQTPNGMTGMGLVFQPGGTLMMSQWVNEFAALQSQFYTVNTTTADATALGFQVFLLDTATVVNPISSAYDTGGNLRCICWDGGAQYRSIVINTTPDPAYSYALTATLECSLGGSATPPHVGTNTFTGPLNKNGFRYEWFQQTGDIYQYVDGGGCMVPTVLKMLAPASMAHVTAVAGLPS